jgi:hypothetical protein
MPPLAGLLLVLGAALIVTLSTLLFAGHARLWTFIKGLVTRQGPAVDAVVRAHVRDCLAAHPKHDAQHVTMQFAAYGLAFDPERPAPAALATFEGIEQAAAQFGQFVLLGEPGGGKTTALRHLLRERAKARLAGQTHTVPLWVDLGCALNPVDAGELLHDWQARYGLDVGEVAHLPLEDFTLLLDGLDALPPHDRGLRAASLRALLADHPDVPAVITCSTHHYRAALRLGLPVVVIQPLDAGHVRAFLERCGNPGRWAQLRGAVPPYLDRPYHLAMACVAGQTPHNLRGLYAAYARARYMAAPEVTLSWEELEARLRGLAFAMITAGQGVTVPAEWARRQIGAAALADGLRAGLLVEREEACVAFCHPLLGSYCALPLLVEALRPHWYDRINPTAAGVVLMVLFPTTTLGVAALLAALALYRRVTGAAWAIDHAALLRRARLRIPFVRRAFGLIQRRVWALEHLADLGPVAVSAIPALRKLARDPNPAIRAAAGMALHRCTSGD